MKYLYLLLFVLIVSVCGCAGTTVRDPSHETAYPQPVIQQADHFQ